MQKAAAQRPNRNSSLRNQKLVRRERKPDLGEKIKESESCLMAKKKKAEIWKEDKEKTTKYRKGGNQSQVSESGNRPTALLKVT